MRLFEIIQDGKQMFVNLERVLAITEGESDTPTAVLWFSLEGDGECFIADEPLWEIAERIKNEANV